MHVWTTSAPPFYKNGFVVACERTRHAVVIDPGDDVEEQLAIVRREGVTVTMILLTHAHLDHVTGVAAAKAALAVDVWLHGEDLFLYERAVEQGRMFGIDVQPQPRPESRSAVTRRPSRRSRRSAATRRRSRRRRAALARRRARRARRRAHFARRRRGRRRSRRPARSSGRRRTWRPSSTTVR